jgi:hypothetical protein
MDRTYVGGRGGECFVVLLTDRLRLSAEIRALPVP